MIRSRARLSRVLVWCALLLFCLRPHEGLDRALAWLAAPGRLVAELVSPLRVLRHNRVQAAEARIAERVEEEQRANEELLAALARSARPSEPALVAGRRLVHGEVIGRDPESKDRLRVRLHDARGVRRGQPVCQGNAYVGRVVDVQPGPVGSDGAFGALVGVELATAKGFHVGARVVTDGEEVLMTVGGLDASSPEGERADLHLRLAVHNPSDRKVSGGIARVYELFADAEPYSELSEGLRLGLVQRAPDGQPWIEPELDYLDGLFQVVVLAPPDAGLPSGDVPSHALEDRRWLAVSPLGVADPAPWREAVKIDAGWRRGVRAGAAVTAGARLVGRVTRAGPWTADVSFPGDRGSFSVVAVARLEGDPEPRVLGRLVSLGRDEAGEAVLFHWVARRSLGLEPGSAARRAELFSGSGDEGLESGLYLGHAWIPPLEPGRVPTVRLELDADARDVGELYVRIAPASEVAGGEAGP